MLLLLTGLVVHDGVSLQRYDRSEVHMGTEFHISLYAPDDVVADRGFRAAFARIAELNSVMSNYDPESELSRLCQSSPHATPQDVSRDLWFVLRQSHQLWKESDGAFDVTVGPLTRLWRRARRQKQFPSPQRQAAALEAVGSQHMVLGEKDHTLMLLKAGMELDLGGIAKGYAVDEALACLERHGIHRALVNGGGDLAASGAPPSQRGWKVGIAPLQPDGPPSRFLLLQRQAVATSGDAWQFVELNGKRYSHILDPRSGLPLTRRSSVTVVAPTCCEADSLASAVSVLELEAARKLIEQRQGAFMLLLLLDGEKVQEISSTGFPAY